MNAPLPRGIPTDGTSDAGSGEIHAPSRPTRTPRRRRRGQRDSDRQTHNHATERWMVSYADFITLLFAFFVVMYAMSSVNEGRYRVLSGALSTAFSPTDGHVNGGGPVTVADPAATKPHGATAESPAVAAVAAPGAVEVAAKEEPKPVAEPPVDPVERAEIAKTAERVQHMTQLATKVDERLQALVRDGQVSVTRGARGIAIEINAAVLFDPAKADLKPASFEALRSLAGVLSGFVEPLQIEGHSDDVPIATREFRSNWELSAARAASVGRFLIEQGVAPNRIGIAGYAEFRPLTGNTSAESRARNRRVTLLVLSADDTRPKEGGPPLAIVDDTAPSAPARTDP
jgi:chemotaxis protein MotB